MPSKKKSSHKPVINTLHIPMTASLSMRTITAKCIEPFLENIRDSRTVESYRRIVEELERAENRRARMRGDGYYPTYDACHKHFSKKLSVFYRYVGLNLHILAIKEHVNDRNHY